MKKPTAFKTWVKDLWYENCDEYVSFKQEPMPIEIYWQKYKWWLKREYRYQTKQKS